MVSSNSEDFLGALIEERKHKELGLLHSYDQAAAASAYMKYGDIWMMKEWCKSQGNNVHAPYHLKRVFGIPLPWYSILSIVFTIMAIKRGLPGTWSVAGGVVSALAFVIVGWVFSEWEFDKSGKCIMCGSDALEKYKEGITVYDHKDKKIRVSRAGYCGECDFPVHRYTWWTAIEAQVRRLIQSSPVKERTWWRTVVYQFSWLWGNREVMTDPRPSPDGGKTPPPGRGHFYTSKDFKKPRDILSEVVIDNAIKLFSTGIDLLRTVRAETQRRF